MPKKFTSRTRRSSSGSSRSASAYTVTIAFAQYVSIRPKRSIACSTTLATSSWTAWSAGTASASEPAASISAAALSSASAFRAVTTTLAPRSPATRAIPRPRPLEAPVTTTTCSASGFFRIALSVSRGAPGQTRYPRVDAEHRNRRDRPFASGGAPALRREAAPGDRTLAREGHAGVQGLGLRQGRRAAAARVRRRRASRRHAGHDRACRPPRARSRLAEKAHEAPAPPRPRRRGDPRRAPRRAADPDHHLARRARRHDDRGVRLPPSPHQVARTAAAP